MVGPATTLSTDDGGLWMADQQQRTDKRNGKDAALATWIAVGIALGAGLGSLMGNPAVGIALGVALGVAMDAASRRTRGP
jgi:hypothetical protein